MPTVKISEEYGYRYWVAVLSDAEYEELKSRWRTMRGLHCLVPVRLIVPQAAPLLPPYETPPGFSFNCHIHQWDDSFLGGVDYEIPEAAAFEMGGVVYDDEELECIHKSLESGGG